MTVPLLLLMTMLDNKSRLLLGFVLCGMVLAVCAYEINSLVCYSLQLSGPELSITAAPVIEEILKALPVLFFAVLVSDERKQILQLAMAARAAWHGAGNQQHGHPRGRKFACGAA